MPDLGADDRVKRVAHFVRNRGVDERREAFLCLQVVVEDVGVDIDELQSDHFLVLVLGQALLDLKEPVAWHLLQVQMPHISCPVQRVLDLRRFILLVQEITCVLKYEDSLRELLLVHINDFIQRIRIELLLLLIVIKSKTSLVPVEALAGQ